MVRWVLKTIAKRVKTLFPVLPLCYFVAQLSTIAKVSFLLVGSSSSALLLLSPFSAHWANFSPIPF
jgi:hypothetical protein